MLNIFNDIIGKGLLTKGTNMKQFRTLRGKALHEKSKLSILEKLWLAVVDFQRATTDKEFSDEWGDAEAFQHDMFIFVEQCSISISKKDIRS